MPVWVLAYYITTEKEWIVRKEKLTLIIVIFSLIASLAVVFGIWGIYQANRFENLFYEQGEVTKLVVESADEAMDGNYSLASQIAREAADLQSEISEKL